MLKALRKLQRLKRRMKKECIRRAFQHVSQGRKAVVFMAVVYALAVILILPYVESSDQKEDLRPMPPVRSPLAREEKQDNYYDPLMPPSPVPGHGRDNWQTLIPVRREKRVDCAAIIDGDVRETRRAQRLSAHLAKQEPPVPLEVIQEASRDCDGFLTSRGYVRSHLSQDEATFPLAFSILVYTDTQMAERLLRAIYRPHNYYCIHVDLRAPPQMYQAFVHLASCLANVVMADRRVAPVWATFSVLDADLACMQTLWRFTKWKYFINLTGQEFPLKTNSDLVRILKALNGSNDVHSNVDETYIEWYRYRENPPPSWFRPVKGSVHVTLSRAFVDFVLHDQVAASVLDWVKDMTEGFQDETLFSTLNHNPQLGAPGAYSITGNSKHVPEKKPHLSRYKVWNTTDDFFCASGKWVRGICILTVGDLPLMVRSVHLFANKFHLQQDQLVISCLEEYLFNTTLRQFLGWGHVNTSFYENLDAVKNQIRRAPRFT